VSIVEAMTVNTAGIDSAEQIQDAIIDLIDPQAWEQLKKVQSEERVTLEEIAAVI
jgi:hypothetical protein